MDHHHFRLGHFLDGVLGAFLAETAVLEATVWRKIRAPHGAPINVQIATLHLVRKPQGGVEVLGEDARTQTVVGIIGQCDGLVNVCRACYAHRWAK